MSTTNSGFTIPELIIAITVSAVLLGMLFGPLNDLYRSSSTGLRSIVQVSSTRAALRKIEHNITLSSKFLPSNINNSPSSDDIPDTANNVVWNWQGQDPAHPEYRVLITQGYGTDSNGNAVLTPPSCDVTAPQTMQYIYFVQNQSLFRRALFASSYPSGCNGNVNRQPTCPPATSRPAACKANDALIATGVTKFSVDYYTSANSPDPLDNACGDTKHTCYTASTAGTTTTSAHSIVVTIEITTGTGVNAVASTSQMRLTRINGT